MLEYKQRLDSIMLQLQALIDEEYEDNDYVLQSVPCTFLGVDNYCSIYEVRPKACREYPHTNRKDFHKISQITMKNIEICPAAFNIVEKLKLKLNINSQKFR